MRDTSTLLPSAGRLSRSRGAVASRGGGRFCASPPQVRKSLRLRYGAVTSENGTPGDGSTGRGTGPAPRRAAKRQPAGTLGQARAAARPRAAKAASAGRDQGNALARESEVRPAVADGTGPAGERFRAARGRAPAHYAGAWRPVEDSGGHLAIRDRCHLRVRDNWQRPVEGNARRTVGKHGSHPDEDGSIPRPAQAGHAHRRERSGAKRSAGHGSSQHDASHRGTRHRGTRHRGTRHEATPSAGHGSRQQGAGCATRHT